MKCIPLTADTAPDWDSVAGGWFWHTRAWLDYIAARGDTEDRSFLIYDDGPVAICPVKIETVAGIRRFSYQCDFMPAPVVKKKEVWAVYADELERIAAAENIGYARIQGGERLLRHGFMQIQAHTQIIDLTPPSAELWTDVQKGTKYRIKQCGAQIVVHGPEISEFKFEQYRAMHAADAGRVTRPRQTFDMMRGWIERGDAILIEAARDDAPVAFALVITHGKGAYYASSCSLERDVMHGVIWAAIYHLKAQGFEWFELGAQHFGDEWADARSEKDVSISLFKRCFGGETKSVPTFERFYSQDAAVRICTERTGRLARALSPMRKAA